MIIRKVVKINLMIWLILIFGVITRDVIGAMPKDTSQVSVKEIKKLTDKGWYSLFGFSGDSTKIDALYYETAESERGRLVSIDIYTGNEEYLCPGEQEGEWWYYDIKNRKIFVEKEAENEPGLWIRDFDGSNERKICDDKGGSLAWSSDLSKIAYTIETRDKDKKLVQTDLYVLKIDGMSKKNKIYSAYLIEELTWSPVKDEIAFLSDGLYVINTEGKNLRGKTGGYNIIWSPDGTKIVSHGTITSVTEEKIEESFDFTDADYDGEDWSPDGNIVVGYNTESINGGIDPESMDSVVTDIFIMNANGTGYKVLTKTLKIDETDSYWSPDGLKIGCIDGKTGEVYILFLNVGE